MARRDEPVRDRLRRPLHPTGPVTWPSDLPTASVVRRRRRPPPWTSLRSSHTEFRTPPTSELIKWIVGTAIALIGAAVVLFTFALNHAKPVTPLSSPAPIVLTLPPATVQPPPNVVTLV